jgi:hypothetical protein
MMQADAKGERGLKRANVASVRGGGGGGGGENDDASVMSQTSTSNVSDIDDVSIDADTKSSMMMTTKPSPPHPSIDTSTNYPYHSYLKSLPRWKWLNADTLPVPKSMLSDAEGEL